VVDSYRAGLADELNLAVNDKIECQEIFDDGCKLCALFNFAGALGTNITTGKIGAFPVTTCIPEDSDRNSKLMGQKVKDRGSSYKKK
jgi:hypothetical protein